MLLYTKQIISKSSKFHSDPFENRKGFSEIFAFRDTEAFVIDVFGSSKDSFEYDYTINGYFALVIKSFL